MRFKDKILYNLIQSIYELYLYLWNQIKEAVLIKGVFFPLHFRQGFIGAPAAAERIEEKQQFPLLTCSLPEQGEGGGGKDFPYMR